MAKRNPITVKVDKVADFAKGIELLGSTRVMAGIPADKATRDEGDGVPINNAELMYIHEHGDPERNLPKRPVMEPALASIKDQIIKEQEAGARAVMAGGGAAVANKMFHRIGIIAQNALRRKITTGPFAPLSPRTIAARLSEGFTGEKPLIRTGQLRRAFTYVIEKVKFRR